MDHTELVGRLVLSPTLGVGKVVGIEDLGIGDSDFLVIETEDKRVKNYIPLHDENQYRLLSSKRVITNVLNSLGGVTELQDFESKKDRIHYFRSSSKEQDIKAIARILSELHTVEDRGTVENQVYKSLIDTLALEYSLVLKVELKDAKKLVKEKIQGVQL